MKKIFILFLSIICFVPVNAKMQEKVTVADSLMIVTLHRYQGQLSIPNLLTIQAEMSRIADMYPDYWLPSYYQTWLGIQLSLITHNQQGNITEQCIQQIDKLQQMNGVDLSEVYVLKAYYYYVLIALNAKENGPVYYSQVFGSCEKALKINSNNPRALAISYVFKKQMASFMNTQVEDDSKTYQAICDLFDQENEKTLLPHWGKEILKYINRK